SLNQIELDLLKDIKGKSILHLQCHFGQDSISLARMGAKVTAVDFSDKAIDAAKELCTKLGVDVNFLCSDIYELPHILDGQFDIVFTSYGTIGWLPDLQKWAKVVSHYLKNKGEFIFVEFHPVVWMFDDDFSTASYSYFNTGPIVENESGTYADRNAEIQAQNIAWNHGMAEVMQALIDNNLQLRFLEEYDYSPYNCFRHTEEFEPGKFRIRHLQNKLPMLFDLKALKTDNPSYYRL